MKEPKDIKNWFWNIDPTYRTILIYAVAILIMASLLAVIPPPPSISNRTSISSPIKLPIPKLENPSLKGFLVKNKEKPITLEDYMCQYMYSYNFTNITWGNTTCFKWENGDYDCVCITPLG